MWKCSIKMKKWFGGGLVGFFFVLLVLRYSLLQSPTGKSPLFIPITINSTNPLEWHQDAIPPTVEPQDSENEVMSADALMSSLFHPRNFSGELQSSLLTWYRMSHLLKYTQGLPNAVGAIQEAGVAWENLMGTFESEQNEDSNGSSVQKVREKQCPHFLSDIKATGCGDGGYRLQIPCGLIQGSSITIIGIPKGLLGDFRIDLTGEPSPGVADPPIVLHYNVRLHGDKLTENPVIVQNTWTAGHDWGAEERCPLPVHGESKKVDDFNRCNEIGGNNDHDDREARVNDSLKRNRTRVIQQFPFKQGSLNVMTLRVGEEGIQMTVDGKHITSFSFRESLEPWLVSQVRISGDLELISVLASGLPTSEGLDEIVNLEELRTVTLPIHHQLDLFIGVFSTANNFKRRMAVRRAWMQYPAIKAGVVAVRFFVGLHKNQRVNEELWTEVKAYGDIQLMPFVDYYSLITWKTIAICIFGTEVVSAKYVMKTDDDAFVRVDEVLSSLNRANVTHGLLYGLINTDARPHRSPDSKWYISLEEWPESTYPPWAHGPGYAVSHDIAKAVAKRHKGRLKMFKLEDVAMGIWIAELKKRGMQVIYINEPNVYNEGCGDEYVVAHYQSPSEMLCLWQKLQEERVTIAICIFGTEVVSAKYVMKTDDDAFVRVDEVLSSLNRANVTHGLLYGLINTDARPHRSPDSKWYISLEEWPESTYPPWAHGPGYAVSHDIAKAVAKRHKGRLKMFKLEDVAMGIWIAELKKRGMQVIYINEPNVYNEGCGDEYVVAHYQSPSEMLCLWQKLQEERVAKCCGGR